MHPLIRQYYQAFNSGDREALRGGRRRGGLPHGAKAEDADPHVVGPAVRQGEIQAELLAELPVRPYG